MKRYPIVHLPDNSGSRRDSRAARGFPLYERPYWPALLEKPFEVQIKFILDWLNVEESERYQRESDTITFCNIYVTDIIYLLSKLHPNHGYYLPHVFWTKVAIEEFDKGNNVLARYGTTISELNANALYEWLSTYGYLYNWLKTSEIEVGQYHANDGSPVIVCGKGKKIGHVTYVLPDNDERKLDKKGNLLLHQSQAGYTNSQEFWGNAWCNVMEEWGIWINMEKMA